MSLSATALITVQQAKTHLRKDEAAATQVFAEYVGAGDDSEVAFDLDNTPVEGSLKLYNNGTLQVETTDYSITTATVTFVTAPATGEIITAAYDYAASDDTFEDYDDELIEILINSATEAIENYTGRAFVNRTVTETQLGEGQNIIRLYKSPVASITSVSYEKVDDFEGDGETITFTLGSTPMAGSYTVYVAGTLMTETTEYTISSKTLTFDSAPADEALVIVRYNVALTLNTDYTEQLSTARLKGMWYNDYEYQIVYTAGYATTRALTQAAIPLAVTACMITVSTWYENRLGIKSETVTGIGSVSYGDTSELPKTAKDAVSSIRRNLI